MTDGKITAPLPEGQCEEFTTALMEAFAQLPPDVFMLAAVARVDEHEN